MTYEFKQAGCSVEGCMEKATRKSMCQKHYRRMKIHGDPAVTNRRTNGDGKGFWNGGGKGKHVLTVETILGKSLPAGAVVHHVNHEQSDNRPSNLVACQSQSYHSLLHMRERALLKTGNANWRKCKICQKYGSPNDVTLSKKGIMYHPECNRRHVERYAKTREGKSHGRIYL